MNKAEEVAYHYYNGQVPDISELRVISETPEFNLATVRWKESKVTITVKFLRKKTPLKTKKKQIIRKSLKKNLKKLTLQSNL